MSVDRNLTLITGATGLIGHYLLTELLTRGRRCAVLLRPPLAESQERLACRLWALGHDLPASVKAGRVLLLEGDLNGPLPGLDRLGIGEVVHGAAATNFTTDPRGEPARTNVDGTAALLQWIPRDARLHLISSAYVCGRTSAPAAETMQISPPEFHNDYEQSKWTSEQLATAWAARQDRQVTIYRPSVVVGAFDSGRSTKFSGVYLSARATELLDRVFRDASHRQRHAIPLRLKGSPNGHQNIVPVDYVARAIATIVQTPSWHGGIYHLTHPEPPTNALIKRAYEHLFDLAGGRFVPPEAFDAAILNEYEQRFYDVSRSIEHYFVDTPTFLRDRTACVERASGLVCPAYDQAAIMRLVAFAQMAQWGRDQAFSRSQVPGCATYFESFLPAHVNRSKIARITGLSTTIRFVIADEENGEWICRFDQGRLTSVRRGSNETREDFGYRATRAAFWQSISGEVHPDQLFLSGRAEIFGDVEKALKMALILHEFTREFPCRPTTVDPQTVSS